MILLCPARFEHHLTLLLAKTDLSRATHFSQEEQRIIMEAYEEYKKIITAKSKTVAANKARGNKLAEEC